MAVLMAMGPDKDKYSFNSITCELLDDQLVYELQVPANCYRAEKLPLYYAGEVAELGRGQLLGTLGVTPEVRGKIAASSGEMVPESYHLTITEEEDRLIVNGDFTEGEYATVVLIGDHGDTHQYQINTVPRQFLAMCVGTFQKSSATNFDKYISKEGLFGQYDVKLLSEGKVYDTGVTIAVN